MKKITAYVTSDGKIWPDHQTAKNAAFNKFAAAVEKIAHKLVRMDKYTAVQGYLEGAVEDGSLLELIDLRKDCDVQNYYEQE